MEATEAARIEVRAWLLRLGVLVDAVSGVHVTIEGVDEHRKLRYYRVRMDLVLPEGVVSITRDHPSNLAHEDIFVAIRNAFRAARRELAASRPAIPGPLQQPADAVSGPLDLTSALNLQAVPAGLDQEPLPPV